MRAELCCFLAMTMASLAGSAGAEIIERESIEANAVDIERFAGIITVKLGSADRISMKLDAPKDVLDGATIEVVDDRLSIRDVWGSGRNTVVVTGDVRAVARDGGTASVTIGGDGAEEEPTELTLTVPVGTAMTLRGFTGSARIPDLEAPLQVEVTSATVTAGKVMSADLHVKGSGTIEVARVSGDLTMAINGGGNISVATGMVGKLDASLNGSGTIEFGGAAEAASIRGQGAGRIAVAQVTDTPDVETQGAVQVTIGNR